MVRILSENKKYNILILSASLFIGGAEQVIANIVRFINYDLFNVSACYIKARGDIGEKLYNDGFNVYGIPKFKFKALNHLNFIKLRDIIRKKKIDLNDFQN